LGLVPEVNACFEQLFHGDVSQNTSSLNCILCGFACPLRIDSLLRSRRCGREDFWSRIPGPAARGTFRLAEPKLIRLPLAELEALACPLLSVLLAFLAASIAGKEAGHLQLLAELNVELQQGAGDAHLQSARLAVDSTAGYVGVDIKSRSGLAGY